MTVIPAARLDRLVDLRNGTISRELFVDQDIFQQEMEQIFARAWLFVGHEDLIPKPFDFFTSRMGQESVILTRDGTGEIHVLLNSCAHRGMKVCRYDSGNARNFTCPYHAWTYSIDGARVANPGDLATIPRYRQFYGPYFKDKDWGLPRAPHVFRYKGTVWASWDKDAPPFLDYIGNMKLFLDAALDHRDGSEGGSELIGGVQKWRIPCNWKFPPENFIGDQQHGFTHQSVNVANIGPSGKGRRDDEAVGMAQNTVIGFERLGHGVVGHLPTYQEPPYVPQYTSHPIAQEYDRQVYERRVKNLGDRMRVISTVGTIFPSMSFHGRQPRTIAVFHPVSPGEVEMWRMYFVDKDAPAEVKDMLRHYYMRYSGPGGLTESDDTENWSYATEASKGPIASRHPYNYQLGIDRSKPVKEIEGAIECGYFSEQNARIYYARWRDFMSGASWDQLMSKTPARPSMVAGDHG